MEIAEIKKVNGNVCKIKHGKRTAYYAYYNITSDGSVFGYEVDKKGNPRRSKYGLVHEYPFVVDDVIEVLPITASKWH